MKDWCWTRRPDSHSLFQFIPKVLDGIEVRVSHVLLYQSQTSIYSPRFVHSHVEKAEALPWVRCHKVEVWNIQLGWHFTKHPPENSWKKTHFISQMFTKVNCLARCLILCTYDNGCNWNTWIQELTGVARSFYLCSVVKWLPVIMSWCCPLLESSTHEDVKINTFD